MTKKVQPSFTPHARTGKWEIDLTTHRIRLLGTKGLGIQVKPLESQFLTAMSERAIPHDEMQKRMAAIFHRPLIGNKYIHVIVHHLRKVIGKENIQSTHSGIEKGAYKVVGFNKKEK